MEPDTPVFSLDPRTPSNVCTHLKHDHVMSLETDVRVDLMSTALTNIKGDSTDLSEMQELFHGM